jgi:hypothetical protein
MKKFLKLSALLIAVMSVLFLGCSSDSGGGGGPGGGEDVPVTSISILINNYTENDPYTLFEGDDVKLTAQVLPGTATDKGYSLEVIEGKDDVVTLDADGTLTAVGDGTAKVQITSTGKKADGTFATSTFGFIVTNDPELITEIRLLVHNQNKPTDPATTTTAVLNNDNRYVIVNNEADAQVTNTRADVRGNTILYINKPLKMPKNEDDSYTPYSISGRIKITGTRTTGQPATGGNYGVITGIFTNPKIPVSATTPLKFVGARSAAHGRKQMYITRDASNNDNSSSGFTLATESGIAIAPGLDKEDSAADKVQGFKEQEYIFKVVRTTSAIYDLKIFSADGETELASGQRGKDAGNNLATILQSEDEYLYLGFIISGVTVEISDIVVKDGETELFKSPAATPYPQPVLKVSVTATDPVGADANYNYQCINELFPNTGVQLNAKVLPIDATQTITWSVSSGTNGSVSSAGLVTITGPGAFTVKAQSTDAAFGEFKFNILAERPAATAVNISGLSMVLSGEAIDLKAAVLPALSDQTVTWSVFAEDGTTATTAAEIDSSTGQLTAKTVTTDTVVKVFATTANNIKSEAHEVTVRPSGSGPAEPQIWQTDITTQATPTVQPDGNISLSTDKKVLTMKGSGRIAADILDFNFVYLPVTDVDFTMVVKVDSYTFGAPTNNATKLGIIALSQTDITRDAAGALTGVKAASECGGIAVRPVSNTTTGEIEWSIFRTSQAGYSTTSLGAATSFMIKLQGRLDATSSNRRIYVNVSTDNGATWGSEKNLAANTSVQGNIYVGIFVGSNPVSGNATTSVVNFSSLLFASGTGMGAATVTNNSLTPIDFAWLEY